jgi:indolepyruvate ferredoxin oxidoreductase beta subunit
MEALRYKPYLSSEGWFITNSTPFVNIPDYPDMEVIISEIDKFKNKVLLDGDKIAKELGSARSMNVVILGAASSFLDIPYEKLEEGIKFIFARKGEAVINANLNAMKAGREMAEKSK